MKNEYFTYISDSFNAQYQQLKNNLSINYWQENPENFIQIYES